MAMSFSQPDPASPTQVADATFSTSRRGFDQAEVREFLRMVGAEMSRLSDRIRFLEREVEAAQTSPELSARLDEETLTRLLGEETARVLSAARSSSAEIRQKAEQAAAQLVSEASDEAARIRNGIEAEAVRLRSDAAADAEAELEMAKQQGREMVNEARAYRERVLSELARRRELAREQIEQLLHGRDRLLDVFERARVAAVDVVAELEPIGQPDEYVNLAPTTGPVPVMVAREAAPVAAPVAATPVEDAEIGAADDPGVAVDVDAAAEQLVDDGAELETADVSESIADEADTAESDTAESDTAESDTAESDTAESDTAESDTAESDTAETDTAETDAAESDTAQSDTAETDADDTAALAPGADGAEVDVPETDVVVDMVPDGGEDDDVVVDLFARLRSAADATDATDATDDDAEPETPGTEPTGNPAAAGDSDTVVDTVQESIEETIDESIEETIDESIEETIDDTIDETIDETDSAADDVFSQRDAELTPLIVAAARKLKRVLADEQNEVLDTMRRSSSIASLEELVEEAPEHAAAYVDAVADDLLLGAQAGAAGTDAESVVTLSRPDARGCVDRAGDQLAERLVGSLRDRLERAIAEADGDADALSKKVRATYREVKTRAIDEVLDDVFRTAYGAGVSASIAAGITVRWTLDPRHPACPDCEDNSLSPAVPHGQPFPTGDRDTPAHPGCRCLLQISPR